MGNWKDRGNHYTQFICVLYCKPKAIGKQFASSIYIGVIHEVFVLQLLWVPFDSDRKSEASDFCFVL